MPSAAKPSLVEGCCVSSASPSRWLGTSFARIFSRAANLAAALADLLACSLASRDSSRLASRTLSCKISDVEALSGKRRSVTVFHLVSLDDMS